MSKLWQQNAKLQMPKLIKTCQNVFLPTPQVEEEPHEGEKFTICTLFDPDRLNSQEVHRHIISLANDYTPHTIVNTDTGDLVFFDPIFHLESKHLARSAYLGHLEEGTTEKGCPMGLTVYE